MARHLKRRGPGKRALLQAHEERLADARVLFRAGRWTGATYMAGYVVECLHKAAILSRRGLKGLPEEYWHHDLQGLAARAGLFPTVEDAGARDAREALGLISRLWDVRMRYEGSLGSPEGVRDLLESVEVLRKWLLSKI